MAKLSRQEREGIARRRLISVLRKHGIANARTLEQKISDAGPTPQRIDPHVLTRVRRAMEQVGVIARTQEAGAPWFHLPETKPEVAEDRLTEQVEVFRALSRRDLSTRVGQVLEIATYRSLQRLPPNMPFFGRFTDLEAHDDSTLFQKEEPPSHIGPNAVQGNEKLDFLVFHPEAGALGLECKNVRQWLYPDRDEITETIVKCLALDCVPVVIARRIPYVTFHLLNACGVIIHQTYNQLLPASEAEIAERAKHKLNLGYHDIRIGNAADARLERFVTEHMPLVASAARERYNAHKDLLRAFVEGQMRYTEFAARVRRRGDGLPEDRDDDLEEDPADWF